MANISTDKAIFTMTPAPSGQNQSKEIWNGYLNDTVDEINVVDMRTNELVGTIGGGNTDYKFNKLPTSYISRTVYDGTVIGDAIEIYGGPDISTYSSQYHFRLKNGDIARINGGVVYSRFNNGIMIFGCTNLNDSKNYFAAFKINEDDKTLLEKVAEIEYSTQFENNGYYYTYRPIGVDNECYFIIYNYPTSDSIPLETLQTKLTITESNGIYTLTSEDIVLNYGGKTVLELYNENAPSPVSGVDWLYRSPFYSSEDLEDNMLNGRDEGWVWYGNFNSGTSTLYPYLAGFNIVTGETAYIEPINSLANTTNFNPIGTVDYTYFSNNWESHPAGVYFAVYNQQPFDNGDNTNSVTALYSPRWVNNDKVTFLTNRNYFSGSNTSNGSFSCNIAEIFNGSNGTITNFCFDSENIVLVQGYGDFGYGSNLWMSRYKLDSSEKIEENKLLPIAYIVLLNYGLNKFIINDACIFTYRQAFGGQEYFSKSSYIYWQIGSDKPYQLQSNNNDVDDLNNLPFSVIGNRFTSIYSESVISLAIEYDEYKKVVI